MILKGSTDSTAVMCAGASELSVAVAGQSYLLVTCCLPGCAAILPQDPSQSIRRLRPLLRRRDFARARFARSKNEMDRMAYVKLRHSARLIVHPTEIWPNRQSVSSELRLALRYEVYHNETAQPSSP